MKFALIGASGYIAPRHMRAIKETGNELVSALDKSDSVGIIDSYFPDASFFTEPERFDRHIYRNKVDYVSICSPNYLHDAHIRMALRNGADVICEKPIVLNPRNLDALQEIELQTGQKVWCILQLRLHKSIIELKKSLDPERTYEVQLDYVTPRGKWYMYSWKNQIEKSGGLAMNIGVHFFDVLGYLFGDYLDGGVSFSENNLVIGNLKYKRARVYFGLSISRDNLPAQRKLTIDGEEVDFSDGFTDLHTKSYQEILDGKGFGLDQARQSIEIVNSLR